MESRSALVSTGWLAEHLSDPDIRIVDATFHLPTAARDADAEYAERHIPGAVRFDVDKIKDHASPLPHMAPPPAEFAAAVAALGVSNQTRVVAYDAYGLMSAARIWWMFRLFGHDDVVVLDGGLPKWLAEGRPTESGVISRPPGHFTAGFRPELVLDQPKTIQSLLFGPYQIVDARSKARFDGVEPEPRPGLRGGHMPNSLSLPFTELLDPQTRVLLPPAELEARFAAAGVDLARPVAATCGSGVTACVLALALNETGRPDAPVYDGAWVEWALNPALPVHPEPQTPVPVAAPIAAAATPGGNTAPPFFLASDTVPL